MSESTTAVVTGAGRGIGLAIARQLAAAGHRVLLTDIDADAAKHAAVEIGSGAWSTQQDVRDPSGHRDIAAQASSEGRLAVWVNNAGILIAGDSWTHTDQELMSGRP
jgi:NAD(P)-dependent dehydrogenase (short-subunit alcohol dehydrogenase family)